MRRLILDRYVARCFLTSYGLVVVFVFGLFLLIDLIAHLSDVAGAAKLIEEAGRTTLGVVAEYYLRSLPSLFLMLAPVLTLVAATTALVRLLRANEITPMVAAGRSPFRIGAPILVLAALTSLGMAAMQEWVVPAHAAARSRLADLLDGDLEARVDDLEAIRDVAGTTWHVELYFPRQHRIEGARTLRLHRTPAGPDEGVLTIRAATWRERGPAGPGWYPEDAVLRPMAGDFRGPLELPEDRPLDVALSLEDVEVEYLRQTSDVAQNLSISQAARIVRRYPTGAVQAVAFHRLIAWPAANLLLVLLGLPLVLRFRSRNLLVGVGTAILVCAAYFAVARIGESLGERGEVAPAAAVWFPVVLFSAVAAGILDYQRGLRTRRTTAD